MLQKWYRELLPIERISLASGGSWLATFPPERDQEQQGLMTKTVNIKLVSSYLMLHDEPRHNRFPNSGSQDMLKRVLTLSNIRIFREEI
jgi:hypothetical protein